MRIILQRVSRASVAVKGEVIASIGTGFMALVGFGAGDEAAFGESKERSRILTLLEKIPVLRVFPDENSRMNKNLTGCGGELLLVSQFTLYADCSRGRRPSFQNACPPEAAAQLFDFFCCEAEKRLPGKVRRGVFGATMDVALVNSGPVTICLSTDENPEAETS